MLAPITAAEALSRRQEVAALFAACFADPPWYESAPEHTAALPRKLEVDLRRSGLECVGAFVPSPPGRLVGLAYAWPAPKVLPLHEPFYAALHASAGAAAATHRLVSGDQPVLEVAELMVHPEHRRTGIATQLLAALVGARAAWLCTHPDAPASRLYAATGWDLAGRFTSPSGHRRAFYTRSADG